MHKKPKIAIIAAIGLNRELGKDNKLLWHISEDLKRFKMLTTGHTVIMGRKTYESIGRPLPDRLNIVVTREVQKFLSLIRQRDFYRTRVSPLKSGDLESEKIAFASSNLIVCSSLEKAIDLAKSQPTSYQLPATHSEVFVIGGGQIYTQALPYTDKLYLTIVEETFDADTFFPDYSLFRKVIYKESKKFDKYQCTFLNLEK